VGTVFATRAVLSLERFAPVTRWMRRIRHLAHRVDRGL